MAYCLADDVTTHAPAIEEAERAASHISQGIVVATSRVDSSLKAKFVTPFSDPVPGLVFVIAVNLAAGWALKSAFSGSPESNQYRTGEAYWNEGVKLLEQVREGLLQLEDASSQEVIATKSPPIAVQAQRDSDFKNFDVLGRYGPKVPGRGWCL